MSSSGLPPQRDEIAILYQAGRLLASTLDPDTVYDTMRELVAGIMDCDGLLVSTYSPHDDLIRCSYAWVEGTKLPPDTLPALPLAPMGEGMQSEVIRTGRPLKVDDVIERMKSMRVLYHVNADGSVRKEPARDTPMTRSTLMVPIMLEKHVLGVVQLMSHRPAAYTDQDLRLLEGLTCQMAAAARNAWLYQQAQGEIAERRRTEERLRESEQLYRQLAEALAEADRRKDEFMAMLAHELRNPLGPIRNAVFLMKQEGVREPARLIHMVDRQVTHMTRMIDDLLDMSAITNRKILLRPERLDIVQLVNATVGDFRAGFDQRGVSVELELPAEPVWVMGDPTRLSQAVGNLLNNANKFCDTGARVFVRVVPEPGRAAAEEGNDGNDGAAADAAGRVAISVEDTGIGMEPELLACVFDTFTQADRSLDRSRGGLGLGLALVKGFTELHGGAVEAHSAGPGQGARFTMRLPRAETIAHDGRLPARPHPPIKLRRVLVIEDNEDAAESLRMLLDLNGHAVEVAHAGQSGIESARRFHPDVILCDIGLPGGMNGYDVASLVRSDPVLRETGLIALTGYGQPEDQKRAREAGFDRHLVKPVDPSILTRVLDAI